MPTFCPDTFSVRPLMIATFTLPLSTGPLSRYLYVPAVETDQWLLGRSNVKDSLVFGFSSWRLAPACIGSSGLPGVGIVKLPLDRKLSFSRPLERTLRMSRVPGAG